MRHAMKQGGIYLHAYSPNNGFIAFVWSNAEGIATARKVTVGDIKKYLSRKKLGGHYVDKGYRIVQLSPHSDPVLAPPVTRVSEDTVLVKDREMKYKEVDGNFHVYVNMDAEDTEVHNWSTKAQIKGFLENEKVLTEQKEGL